MISNKTKYGIKALVYLAKQESTTPVRICEIAESEKIPQKFLESILLTLKKNEILGSKKGKGGGYFLLKSASDIPMTQILRALEGPIAMVSCVSLNFYESCDDCPDQDTCSVHNLMLKARDNTLNLFRNTSLQDIL